MIEIPKHNATAVVDWLHKNVGANQPGRIADHERTKESAGNPWSVSVTARIARWRGEHDLWQVTQSGFRHHITVECKDPKIEIYIALRWSQ